MKKALVELVHTLRGEHCKVMPFTDDFKQRMSAQLTTRLNDTDYLEANKDNGLQDFKRNTEMVGLVTKNKTDADVETSIAQFSNQNPVIIQRLRDIPAQKFQIETCQDMLVFTIKFNHLNSVNPQPKLSGSRIRYTKNTEGEFFVNLSYSVYGYQNTQMPMQGFCLTDKGKIIELGVEQFTQLTQRDQGKESEFLDYASQQLHLNLVPLFEIRARIKMRPGVEGAMLYEYVDLELAINHPSISYTPSQSRFAELETGEIIRTKNYHQLAETDQASIDSDKPSGIVIPLTVALRQQFSRDMTSEFNDAAYLEKNKDHAFRDFNRDTQMMGQNTHLQNDTVIAEAIDSFSDHNPIMTRQLRDISGQDYHLMIRRKILLPCLRIKDTGHNDFNWTCQDPITRYTKNSRGEFFINLEYNIYAYRLMTGDMQGYCLSNQGKLIELSGEQIQGLPGINEKAIQDNAIALIQTHIAPLVSVRTRIKLTPNPETNTVEYDCVEMKVALNHQNLSFVPTQHELAEIEYAHLLMTKNYHQLTEEDQAIVETDMPCQVYRFTEEARATFSQEHTQYHNFDNEDLVATDMIERLKNEEISRADILSYYEATDSGHKEFKRGFCILGFNTDGSDHSNKKNALIDRAIFEYTGGNRVFEHRLRCAPGQSNAEKMSTFLQSNLILSHHGETFPIASAIDPVRHCVYTTSADGKKYLNFSFDYYGIMSGDLDPGIGLRIPDPNKSFALTKQGELVRIDAADLYSLKDSNEHVPLFSFRARIELTPTLNLEGEEIISYDFKELEFTTNHRDIQLSETAQQCVDTQNARRTSDYFELRKLNQSRIESDMPQYFSENPPAIITIADLTEEENNRYESPIVVEQPQPAQLVPPIEPEEVDSPPIGHPLPQPKPTPASTNTRSFFPAPVEQDSDVEPISTVPDFDTSEQDDGPPPQGGRNVRPRYPAPEDMDSDQYELLNPFQKAVVRSAHQNSSLRYKSNDAVSVTLRDAENPAATTDHYNVKVTGNSDHWRIQSSHLESSTKLTNALTQSNPATIITIVSKRGPQNDIASIKNDLEALIRLTAKRTLVDVADRKMDYLKTYLNDQSIIQEMKNRFASDGDLTHFMSQITDRVPLHAFIDAIVTNQNELLHQTTNSLRAGM